jgi:hypothetical protein
VCAVALLLGGCATPRADVPGRPASAEATSSARPLVAPAAAGDHVVSQVVRGAIGAREMAINCVVTVKGNEMSVVGLNALGVRLFTLRYDGVTVHSEKSFAVPDQLTPERLLADLQLVYWPLASLEPPLRAAGFSVSDGAPGTRRLRQGERLVAEVHYAGADPWSGRSWLVNLEHGYSLQIDSQAP